MGRKKTDQVHVEVKARSQRILPKLSVAPILGLGVVVAAVLCGGVYLFFNSQQASGCYGRQDAAIYKQAAAALEPGKINDLKKVVDTIAKKPHYSKDANCLYPMVSYYIQTGDLKNTRQYYDKLVKAYKPSKGFVKVLEARGAKFENLKNLVNSVESNNKQIIDNTLYYN